MRINIRYLVLQLFLLSSIISAQQNDNNTTNSDKSTLFTQPITVTIGGNFIVNGSFTALSVQRLDHFITNLFIESQREALASLTQLETINIVKKQLESYPLRGIKLMRADRSEMIIDLLKFRLTGDFKYNPYLKDDDVIIFPDYDEEKDFVDISGAVNKPIKFQYVEGDRLSDAILFAGGISKSYENVSRAEIYRLSADGLNEEIIQTNISDDIELRRGDRIKIIAEENKRHDYKALVLGEVKNPGYVYLTAEGLPVYEVIKRAGGFTVNADLYRAEVLRNDAPESILRKNQLSRDFVESNDNLLLPETQFQLEQKKKLLEMMRLANLTEEDTLFFNIDNQLRVLESESLVDFTKIENPESEESKFLVKDGDVILVPSKFEYVYVFGQVAKAGYFKYVPDMNYKYYIEKAGGLAETAKGDDHVVVIKGKGKNWVTKEIEKLKIEPGDYIYVPKDIPRTTWFYVARTGAVLSIIGSITTIIILILQITK
ncbi:SLBB domain-containing protein [Melioribacter sp. OK-6-Me]|uniref:SLBB domain-containing protein n=1 Tax=unclassified Melioribacter TaxID=2627329 RepID=UPI003ED85484